MLTERAKEYALKLFQSNKKLTLTDICNIVMRRFKYDSDNLEYLTVDELVNEVDEISLDEAYKRELQYS